MYNTFTRLVCGSVYGFAGLVFRLTFTKILLQNKRLTQFRSHARDWGVLSPSKIEVMPSNEPSPT